MASVVVGDERLRMAAVAICVALLLLSPTPLGVSEAARAGVPRGLHHGVRLERSRDMRP
jgi:hypothetical protein